MKTLSRKDKEIISLINKISCSVSKDWGNKTIVSYHINCTYQQVMLLIGMGIRFKTNHKETVAEIEEAIRLGVGGKYNFYFLPNKAIGKLIKELNNTSI